MDFPLEPGLIREGSYSAHARIWDRRQIGESREGRFRFSLDGGFLMNRRRQKWVFLWVYLYSLYTVQKIP
jgi:hypothetical protein